MTQIEAVYQQSVFKPLGGVDLPENQRVRLSIVPIDHGDVRAWLAEVQKLQQQIIQERGPFPDSTPDIAADRNRDE